MSEKKYSFINSFYMREVWSYEGGKSVRLAPDAIIIAYKVDDAQYLKVIPDPDFTFHVAKPHVKIEHYIDHIKKEDVDSVTIKYHDLERTLAGFDNKTDEYFRVHKTRGNYRNYEEKLATLRSFSNSLHLNPRVFGSDLNIEDFYKQQFIKQYGTHIGGYKLMFYDIETDGLSDPKIGQHPINCMSFYFMPTDTMYVYILNRPNQWPTFNAFKAELASGAFEKRLRADPEMNGEHENGKGKFTNVNTKYVFEFFDDEYDMIVRRYEMIHTLKPDFCLAWNFTYDELVTINRLKQFLERKQNGLELTDIICHPDIPKEYRKWFFKEDISRDKQKKEKDYFLKWHTISIPGHTQYLCSMSTFANIRKGRGSYVSFTLNDICMGELKKGKLDYSATAGDPTELPYRDFAMHIHYNIKDVWLMANLEVKNKDVDVLMYLGELTRLPNAPKKTQTCKNKMQQFYESQGLIMANNRNAIIQNQKAEFEGAIIAEPALNEPIYTPLFPYPSRTIRPFVNDLDLASMYPSIAIGNNIYKSSLLFQILSIGSISPERPDINTINISECMDNFQTGDLLSWGHYYLQLPSIAQLVTELDKDLHLQYDKLHTT